VRPLSKCCRTLFDVSKCFRTSFDVRKVRSGGGRSGRVCRPLFFFLRAGPRGGAKKDRRDLCFPAFCKLSRLRRRGRDNERVSSVHGVVKVENVFVGQDLLSDHLPVITDWMVREEAADALTR